MSTAPLLQLVPAQPEQWISRQRFLELAGWTLQWLSTQVRQGNVRTRDTDRKLGNGRFDVEFAASSLPPKARAAFEAEQHTEQPRQQALTLFGPAPVTAAPRIAVSKKAEKEMNERLQILQPILDYKSFPGRYGSLRLANGRAVQSLTDMVRFRTESLAQHGCVISERKLWRMLKQHGEGGAGELARRKRSDADQSRWFTDNPDAAALVASLYLGDGFVPGQSVRACHAALVAQAGLFGLTEDALPSYFTVRRFLMQAPVSLTEFARKGRKRFGETILPYLTRAYTEHSNQIWVSDHMIADVEVANDIFFGDPKLPVGAPIRLRLSCVIDYRSRMVVGYSWAPEESSTSIGAAIRNAVLAYGPAELFYCDNGKAYLKTAKGAQPGYLQPSGPEGWWSEEMDRMGTQLGILGRLGMRVTHCIPHRPQSKHVERFFRTVHAQFCSLWPTYTGGTHDRRPDATAALMVMHRRAVKRGDLNGSMHPLASQLCRAFDAWLQQYHAAPHRGKGLDGRSPAEVFAQHRNPAQRPVPAAEELAVLFYDRVARKIDSCAITLGNVRYVATTGDATSRVAALNGRTVTVAFNRSTPEQVAVLNDDGRLLCLLDREVPIAFAPHDPATQQAIAASMQQSGQLTREVRELHQSITRRRRQIGGVTNIELLAAQVMPGPVPDHNLSPTVRKQPTQRLVQRPLDTADVVDELLSEMD